MADNDVEVIVYVGKGLVVPVHDVSAIHFPAQIVQGPISNPATFRG